MLDKFDELTSWSRNAYRGGRIHRSSRHFTLRRVALDFIKGAEPFRRCALNDMTLRRGALLFVEALYSSPRRFTLRRATSLFVEELYSSWRRCDLQIINTINTFHFDDIEWHVQSYLHKEI